MDGDPWSYAAVLGATFLISVALTPVFLRLARRVGVLDRPGAYKVQESPVPYLGGAAMALAFAVVIVGGDYLSGDGLDPTLVVIMGVASILAVVGLVDDLYQLGPFVRLACEIGAGIALWSAEAGTRIFGGGIADAILTVVWVVGITNAFNLLDNMDGLSSGVAGIAAAWFFVIAAVNGQYLVATLAIALCGCAAGFLIHNFHPARIYMGDAGALFLGFLLATLGVKLRFDGDNDVTFFVPIAVLGIAIFDTTLVTITRVLHRRNPLRGGRDHTSHRLVFMGIPVPVAVGLIYGAAAAVGMFGLILSRVDRVSGFLLMGVLLAGAVFLGVLLGAVPVYETSRRRHLAMREVVPSEPDAAS
jgi:UDP-GlcNAc:undecaprenyl-phosphate GlcNAc-1-phosphate transferase